MGVGRSASSVKGGEILAYFRVYEMPCNQSRAGMRGECFEVNMDRWRLLGPFLVALLTRVYSQSSPCGLNVITVSFQEYPGISDIVDIPPSQYGTYSTLLVKTSVDDLDLSLSEDPNNPLPLSSMAPDSAFRITFQQFRETGYNLTMLKGVDRDGPTESSGDDINVLQYRLTCRVSASEVYFHVLKILISDVNDNAPQFPSTYTVSVNELTPVGLTVLQMMPATDLDDGNNRLLNYSLTTAASSQFANDGYFSLSSSSSSPSIVLTKGLDYESGAISYILNLTATDSGSSPLSSWTLVTVTISDGDDRGPVFSYPSCPVSPSRACIRPKYTAFIASGETSETDAPLTLHPVPETSEPSTVSILVQDGDSLNAPVECSLAYTYPIGYDEHVSVRTVPVMDLGRGQIVYYQCRVFVVSAFPDSDRLPTLDIVILAREESQHGHSETAVIELTIIPSGVGVTVSSSNSSNSSTSSTPCPASQEASLDPLLLTGWLLAALLLLALIVLVTAYCRLHRATSSPSHDTQLASSHKTPQTNNSAQKSVPNGKDAQKADEHPRGGNVALNRPPLITPRPPPSAGSSAPLSRQESAESSQHVYLELMPDPEASGDSAVNSPSEAESSSALYLKAKVVPEQSSETHQYEALSRDGLASSYGPYTQLNTSSS